MSHDKTVYKLRGCITCYWLRSVSLFGIKQILHPPFLILFWLIDIWPQIQGALHLLHYSSWAGSADQGLIYRSCALVHSPTTADLIMSPPGASLRQLLQFRSSSGGHLACQLGRNSSYVRHALCRRSAPNTRGNFNLDPSVNVFAVTREGKDYFVDGKLGR